MSIEILSLRHFNDNSDAIDVALPVLAFECEAKPPLDNYLDVYEETVLKLVSLGLSSRGISGALNSPESLIDEVLDRLERKSYVKREIGRPWTITEDGDNYLAGNIMERQSDDCQFGYIFVNAIKKEVLPYFYQGNIDGIDLFRGERLPTKIILNGDEAETFAPFTPKRSKLREAYRNYCKSEEAARQYDSGDITFEEAEDLADLFEDLETFDEDEEEYVTLSDIDTQKEKQHNKRMFIRTLDRKPKSVYLTMRIIIDPHVPGGYRVESPFDFNGIDDTYFLRQIQWLAATKTAFLGDETIDSLLEREIRKIGPAYKIEEKDYTVFVLEKLPLLKVYKDKFELIYEDMHRIYSLMRCQHSLLEKENIVNGIARCVVESIFNAFFRCVKRENLSNISTWANADLDCYGRAAFIRQILQNTGLNPQTISWTHNYMSTAFGRLNTTKGNSIVEKFINLVAMNYYLATAETQRFFSSGKIQRLYELTDELNQIRKKVSHDTDARFESKDYEFYINNVFELINDLLEAFKEN